MDESEKEPIMCGIKNCESKPDARAFVDVMGSNGGDANFQTSLICCAEHATDEFLKAVYYKGGLKSHIRKTILRDEDLRARIGVPGMDTAKRYWVPIYDAYWKKVMGRWVMETRFEDKELDKAVNPDSYFVKKPRIIH